ncbi:competence type IV pilus minor pilin ComGF [Bacillus mesophilum]|nr:competence type IV pilus minor pilin ComGF [Bacillus mesophilum]
MKGTAKLLGKYVNQSTNEKGFTMLDALYGFTVFLLIMSLIPLTMNHIIQSSETNKIIAKMEWNIFIQQLKKEVRLSEGGIEVANGKLIVRKNQQQISYEKYGSNIRRRVNGTGHEIVMQNVRDVTYEEQRKSLVIRMIDTKDETHTSLITPFITGASQ